MRKLFTILLLIALQFAAVAHPAISEVRMLYYKAASGKIATERFSDAMQTVPASAEATFLAYKGMSLMLKAKYGFNVYSKWNNFSRGKAFIETAVSKEPLNAEVRFLRFCAQTNAPSFLGYDDNIDADKQMLLASWNALADADLKERIRKYMASSEYCNAEEKKLVTVTN